MAISTYAELQAACSSFAGGSSDSNFADAIRTAIALCEVDLGRQLRVPELVVRRLGPIDDVCEHLPSDFSKLISLTLIEDELETPLGQIPDDALAYYEAKLTTGSPRCFVLLGTSLKLVPAPESDGSQVLRLAYYRTIPTLSDDEPTNDVLTAHPDCYVWGSLSVLGEYVEDAGRLPRFEQRFQNAIKSANKMSVLRDGTLAL
jgi:hypothetical protein